MQIREGYALAPGGRSREQAQKALDATKAAGLDTRLVKTAPDGYLIPIEAVEHYAGTTIEGEPAPSSDEPNVEPGEQVEGTGGEAGGDASVKVERPAGNASTEVWQQWAKEVHGETEELTRSEIIEKYPAPAE